MRSMHLAGVLSQTIKSLQPASNFAFSGLSIAQKCGQIKKIFLIVYDTPCMYFIWAWLYLKFWFDGQTVNEGV